MADQQTAAMLHIDSHNIAMLQAIGTLAGSKPVYEYSVPEQRELFNRLQSPRPQNPGVSISEHLMKTSHGEVKTFLYKPESAEGALPFIFYVHGGGWIFGSAMDFESFLFDLVQRTGLAVVFPEYTLAPEKRHPTQIEQCIEVLQDVLEHGSAVGLKVNQIVVAADSVGCQMAAAISILNHQKSLQLPVAHQVLLHPATNTTLDVGTGIFWGTEWMEQQRAAYFSSVEERSNIIASPGLMTIEETKEYMPPTTMITSEHDAFRPEGEAFAKLLQTAGVACGHLQAFASLHAVQLFNQSRTSPTAGMIMSAISAQVREVLDSKKRDV